MSERELRSSVAGASKAVKTNSKLAFDELTRIRPLSREGVSQSVHSTERCRSESFGPLFTGSVAEPALRACSPAVLVACPLGILSITGRPAAEEQLRDKRRHVDLRALLEKEFITNSTWRIAGASFLLSENGEVHSCLLK